MKYMLTSSTDHLDLDRVDVERKNFSDGELYLCVNEDIKGEKVTIISNILTNNLHEVLFTIDAIKRRGGEIEKLFIPYLGYARQDKQYKEGEAVSGMVICRLLRSLNMPVIIFDIHSKKLIENFEFKTESVLPLLASKLPEKEYIIVSPDEGGVKRAKKIAELLEVPIKVMKKTRKDGKVSIEFENHVDGKKILIVEDIISTGSTLAKATKILKENGAKEVCCIATHGLFIGEAQNKLKEAGIDKIYVSNTLPVESSEIIEVIGIESMIKKE